MTTMNQLLYGTELGTELDALALAGKVAGQGKTEPSEADLFHLPANERRIVMRLHESPSLWPAGIEDVKTRSWLAGYANAIQDQRSANEAADRKWFLNHPSA